MYFVLTPIIDMFQYLHYTLGVVLVFVGVKMLTDHWWHMPIELSLGFILLVLALSVSITIFLKKRKC